VVVHAGMPKAGSSSIQAWLQAHSDELARHHDTVLLVARTRRAPDGGNGLTIEEHRGGGVNIGKFVTRYLAVGRPRKHIDRLVDAIADHAARHTGVILSSEGFAQLFSDGDEKLLGGLESLARQHTVRVAYYMRPQHTALEAAWRQWGFRTRDSPAEYVRRLAAGLHYERTARVAVQWAPSVSFEPRPFRVDLLDGGSPVTDFVRTFLPAVDAAEHGEVWENRGLHLDLVNALRDAPATLVGSGPHDWRALRELSRLTEAWAVPESDNVCRSRLVLQAYCHSEFETGNRQLLARLGWNVDQFVPALDDASVDGDLNQLDELWRPRASAAERRLLHAALLSALRRARDASMPAVGELHTTAPGWPEGTADH